MSVSEYHQIPIETVRDQTEVPVDLYILFKEDHYVKIYIGYDSLPSIYENFFNKKVESFYVLKPFLDELNRYIKTSHRSSELMQMDPKDIATKLGLDPENIKEINKTFHNAFNIIKRQDGHLNKILESISAENKYRRKNIILTSYLAISVVKKMPWYKDSLIEKIIFGCIFHDLLIAKEKLAMIIEKDSINSNVLSAQEIKIIKEHGHNMALKVEKIPEIPSDVIHILRDHHERPDGSGFPRGIRNNEIKPITALFIVSEFASNFLLRESLTHMETLHMELEKHFMEFSNFEKVTRQLIKLLQGI